MARRPITNAHPYRPMRGALAGRTFTTERRYRNALAKLRGFGSFNEQRRKLKPIRTASHLAKLRPSERVARERALEAVSLMRRQGLSLSRASREAHTTPGCVRRYADSALYKNQQGRFAPRKSDRLYRQMRVLTPQGEIMLDTHDSRTVSTIGEYWAAVKRYLETGDTKPLRKFRNRSVRAGKKAYRFETRREVLHRLARRGELSFESIYES